MALELQVPFCYTEQRASNGDVDYLLPQALKGLVKGKRVAVVDDVVNAGSAIKATVLALERAHAKPVLIGAMVVYGETACEIASRGNLQLLALEERPSRIWEPRNCPLCAQGVPLEGRA